MDPSTSDLLALIAAVVAGGLIGAEREYHDKPAGFRTLIFICLGACLFTILARRLGEGADDPVRIAAGVVTGVGFLGAGVLVREGSSVYGLTTAASIWATAAVGMAIGGGAYDLAVTTLVLALMVLSLLPRVERWLEDAREARVYRVVMSLDEDRFDALESRMTGLGLRVRAHKHMKEGDTAIGEWEAVGRHALHEELMESFMRDPAIQTVTF